MNLTNVGRPLSLHLILLFFYMIWPKKKRKLERLPGLSYSLYGCVCDDIHIHSAVYVNDSFQSFEPSHSPK